MPPGRRINHPGPSRGFPRRDPCAASLGNYPHVSDSRARRPDRIGSAGPGPFCFEAKIRNVRSFVDSESSELLASSRAGRPFSKNGVGENGISIFPLSGSIPSEDTAVVRLSSRMNRVGRRRRRQSRPQITKSLAR